MIEPDIVNDIEGFNWDEGNLTKNRLKHNVEKKECEEVFFNKPQIIIDDKIHSVAEKRYKMLGITNKKRKLSIVFTFRGKKIRVIMARDQSKKEKDLYNQELNKL